MPLALCCAAASADEDRMGACCACAWSRHGFDCNLVLAAFMGEILWLVYDHAIISLWMLRTQASSSLLHERACSQLLSVPALGMQAL